MANIRTFKLEQVRDGDIVFINACSQCNSLAEIKFEGLDKNVVLKKDDPSTALRRLVGEFQAVKRGGPLSFTITINNHGTMKVTQHTFILSDKDGNEKGLNYVYNIEDLDSGDEDFNDYYINVVAWHRRG